MTSFESVVLLSIGEFDYAALTEASSQTTAAIYFYSFVFIITIVVMQMVIAIIFTAYDGVREKIGEAEELAVMPTILRKFILGRTPSLAEQGQPLLEVTKISAMNVVKMLSLRTHFKGLGHKVVPENLEGENVTPESFSDDHLLQLFDSENVFRLYGILSPKMEETIMKVKTEVATKKEVLKSIASHAGGSAMPSPRGKGRPTRLRSGNEEILEEEAIDPWALNEEEFCHLLHALDDLDTTLHVDIDNEKSFDAGGDAKVSNEFRIAKLIFSAYGRQKSKKKGTFKTRVESKLASILRVVDQLEYRENEKIEAETSEHKAEERAFDAFRRTSVQRPLLRKTSSVRGIPSKGLGRKKASLRVVDFSNGHAGSFDHKVPVEVDSEEL
jgi:hypothetical protein